MGRVRPTRAWRLASPSGKYAREGKKARACFAALPDRRLVRNTTPNAFKTDASSRPTSRPEAPAGEVPRGAMDAAEHDKNAIKRAFQEFMVRASIPFSSAAPRTARRAWPPAARARARAALTRACIAGRCRAGAQDAAGYDERLGEMADKQHRRLVISMNDLREFDSDLARRRARTPASRARVRAAAPRALAPGR